MRDRDKNNKDKKLWDYATKDVVPIKRSDAQHPDDERCDAPARSSAKAGEKATKTRAPQQNITYRHIHAHDTPHAQVGNKETDHRTAQKLKRGQMPIEGRLDLHGMSQNEAYDALLSFIPQAYQHEKRCVLVITGKGGWQEGHHSLLNKGVGVLKQKTPEWLRMTPLDQYVLRVEQARPQHGGDGALYVLLRRNRD